MNVLCDRHHAGLYRSMQLLAARLGWTLYTHVGTEWADEGYWQFGRNQGITDDLARQYLELHDGIWEPFGVRWMTEDSEFPDVPIVGVTLDIARRMKWDFVVATLDDNQQGFRRFADEVGAKYVLQVGNTGQYVDWSLDPLALVSSEVPILGQGVRYHQEMDPAAAAFVDPVDAALHTVSSFVNCMPSIQCYPAWQAAQALLPGFQFLEFGIDGKDGVVKPIQSLADMMAWSAFGWHDKAHGDGFGHVLHGWAAVGRPIIGHGHHYAGKMGEVFWRDGETCIDLDKHPFDEAMTLVREIAANPARHARMCRAIRAVYDTIDYDAETAAIADLLGLRVAVAA